MKNFLAKGSAVKTLDEKLLNSFTKWYTLKLSFDASRLCPYYYSIIEGRLCSRFFADLQPLQTDASYFHTRPPPERSFSTQRSPPLAS